MPQHLVLIPFLFALGACVGSFLNVVVWRLPRGESLVSPPSHCPKCNARLKWYDNVPVVGWLKLGGKCRFCREPISPRYPIVEAVTGGVFVLYYVAYYLVGVGPTAPQSAALLIDFGFPDTWPVFLLYAMLLSCLLAASLIDAEQFIISIEFPWLAAIVGFLVHAGVDRPTLPGALNLGSTVGSATAAGAGVGLAVSMLLWWLKRFPTSFPDGEPMFDDDRQAYLDEIEANRKKGIEMPPAPPPYTPGQIRREMLKEMLFLLPPLVLAPASGLLALRVPSVDAFWRSATEYHWLTGLLGSVLGACVGAFVVWLFRILGTLGFGRLAMGLGDVHLMFGVGAVVGGGAATVAFFLAPFAGLAIAVWRWLTKGKHELPFGPYLSLATAVVMLCYAPIEAYLAPGLAGAGGAAVRIARTLMGF